MTDPDFRDTAPGMGDPTRSDDLASEGLRSDTAGSGAGRDGEGQGSAAGPAPSGDPASHPDPASTPDPASNPDLASRTDPDPGRSGPLGGPLGSAGGGYGTGSGFGTSSGSPDGEDVQAVSGPGPQTDWLRSATGDGGHGGSGDAPPTDLDPQDTEAGRP